MSLYNSSSRVQSRSRRTDLGTEAGATTRDRLSKTSSALSPWVEASWQGTGRALTSTDRHTALFWEQVWLLALPHLGPGNSAYVAPADEIPERKEPPLSFP